MCTAITLEHGDFYFGRTLDLERTYGETVVFVPRNFPLRFREMGNMGRHYAMLGMAHVVGDDPLYYDGFNEKGLAMAGLNFPGNARYCPSMAGKENIAHFELIPWILSRCASVQEAKALLARINITDKAYNADLPVSQLHWMIADRDEAITVEAVRDGVKVYPNPVGVVTNNPSFPEQLVQLTNYMHLSPEQPENRFSKKLDLLPYSKGMGALGLPGDWSSQSRFVRAAFVKLNSVCLQQEGVSQFFHVMDTVSLSRGCCKVGEEEYEVTVYTSCCNLNKGIYYYTTYGNRQITQIDMRQEDMEGNHLISFPLTDFQQIYRQN